MGIRGSKMTLYGSCFFLKSHNVKFNSTRTMDIYLHPQPRENEY